MEHEATLLNGMLLGKEVAREQEEGCEVDLMTNTRHDKELESFHQMRDMLLRLAVLGGVIE
jgi:hypothetical protein